MNEETETHYAERIEIGTATRANEDGTWSAKIQVDNIPSEQVAEVIIQWISGLVNEDLERAMKRRNLQ